MQLSALRPVIDGNPPFATVYLQALPASPDAEQEIRLRWDELRGQLSDAGAHDEALTALDNAIVTENITAIQTEGRVLVANRNGLLLEEDFDATRDGGDRAVLGDLPALGDYVRQRARSVRALVVLVDKEQAAVRREVFTSSAVLDSGPVSDVEGSANEGVHKPREGFLHHRRIQQRADEAAWQNIRDITEHVRKIAERWKPEAIMVAGEVQGRKMLLEELPSPLDEKAYEIDAGGGIPSGTGDQSAEESLQESLRSVARRITLDRVKEQTEHFGSAQANGMGVEGAENVQRAATLGAIDTLLLRYDDDAESEDKLLRAATLIDADVALVGTSVAENVAAVLRYEAPVDQMDVEPTSTTAG